MRLLERHAPTSTLTRAEQRDLDSILKTCNEMGWVSESDELEAEIEGDVVRVSLRDTFDARERAYVRDDRWMFRLLHDCAQGVWRRSRAR